ncbi:MAG: methylenetetrahydrofolate--tRNA-(uracil(54)-C(5))-methyltransferase (FADH(2)-oxidizing) TrmFO [Deltaproteobacteria bacterium]|nr:methylenetetrahydrofolate--tRNA-(uracil(54)-C(5))-methyltransferase (FADH(2)-oxidizing) TrmFO [Deltaproteobacteria bacterium]
MLTSSPVLVVGGGLAGCEAAWQLAERGIDVELHEQKPVRRTAAQSSDLLAELVCSNSMRSAAPSNAVGLLKEELRRSGSLVLACADRAAVPAGSALAVDRDQFSALVTEAIGGHPRVKLVPGEVTTVPSRRPCILATGPLTGDDLAKDLARLIGSEHIAYYDAIAPIVSADSIERPPVFAQSRYAKGRGDDYLNCPLDQAQYSAFVAALCAAEKVPARPFEEPRYFEGCLPIEVMAERGSETLRYGPMKPVGLVDPRSGRRPFAVVQLRQEDRAGTAYNLVGFQTRMTRGEQARVFRLIPGLERAELTRFGSVHRNTFIDSPRLLGRRLELSVAPGLWVAGQLAGVEGYVESTAAGYLAAVFVAASLAASEAPLPPRTTALGGLLEHLRRPTDDFQPSNIVWSLVAPLDGPEAELGKRDRHAAMAERALGDHARWLAELGHIVPKNSISPAG